MLSRSLCCGHVQRRGRVCRQLPLDLVGNTHVYDNVVFALLEANDKEVNMHKFDVVVLINGIEDSV